MARKKREDGLTNLEAKMAELEVKILEKSCFGLIIDDNQACLDCPHKEVCPEYTEARLVKEEESLWVEEVDSELESIMCNGDSVVKPSNSDSSDFDWSSAIAKVIAGKPTDVDGVISALVSLGVDKKTATYSAPIIIKKLVGFGVIEEAGGELLKWK